MTNRGLEMHVTSRSTLRMGVGPLLMWTPVAAMTIGAMTMQTPDNIVLIIGAIGLGLGYAIKHVGGAYIAYRVNYDEKFKGSIQKQLDDMQVKHEQATAERESLRVEVKQIKEERDLERRISAEVRKELLDLTKDILRERGYLRAEPHSHDPAAPPGEHRP